MAEERVGKNNQGSNPQQANMNRNPQNPSLQAEAFNALRANAKPTIERRDSKTPVGKPENILEMLTPEGTTLTRPPAPDIRRKELESTPPKPVQSFELPNPKNAIPMDPFIDPFSDIRGNLTEKQENRNYFGDEDQDQWLLDEEDEEPTYPIPRPLQPPVPQVILEGDVEARITSEMPVVASQSSTMEPNHVIDEGFELKTSIGSIEAIEAVVLPTEVVIVEERNINTNIHPSLKSEDTEIRPDLWSNAPQETPKAQYSTFPPAAPPPEIITNIPLPNHSQPNENIEFIDGIDEELDEEELRYLIENTNHVDAQKPSSAPSKLEQAESSTPPNSVSYPSNFPTDLNFPTIQGRVETTENIETTPPSQSLNDLANKILQDDIFVEQQAESESAQHIEEDSNEFAFAQEMGSILSGKTSSPIAPIDEKVDWEDFAKSIRDEDISLVVAPLSPVETEQADQSFDASQFDQNFDASQFDQNFDASQFDQNFDAAQFDDPALSPQAQEALRLEMGIDGDSVEYDEINDSNDLAEAQALLRQLATPPVESEAKFTDPSMMPFSAEYEDLNVEDLDGTQTAESIEEQASTAKKVISTLDLNSAFNAILGDIDADVHAVSEEISASPSEKEQAFIEAQLKQNNAFFPTANQFLLEDDEEAEDSWSSVDIDQKLVELEEDDSFDGSESAKSYASESYSQSEEDLGLGYQVDEIELNAFNAALESQSNQSFTPITDEFDKHHTPFQDQSIDDELKATHPIPSLSQGASFEAAPNFDDLISMMEQEDGPLIADIENAPTAVPQLPIEAMAIHPSHQFDIEIDENEETDDSWEKKLVDPPIQPTDFNALAELEPQFTLSESEQASQANAVLPSVETQPYQILADQPLVPQANELTVSQDEDIFEPVAQDQDLDLGELERSIFGDPAIENPKNSSSFSEQKDGSSFGDELDFSDEFDIFSQQAKEFEEHNKSFLEREQSFLEHSEEIQFDDLKLPVPQEEEIISNEAMIHAPMAQRPLELEEWDAIDLDQLHPETAEIKLENIPSEKDRSTSPPQTQLMIDIDLEDLSQEIPSADEIREADPQINLADFSLPQADQEVIVFDVQQVETPTPCLPTQFFVKNPLPNLGYSPLEKTLTPILKTLYLAIRQESNPQRCATHLMDFASIVYEFLNLSELAYQCAQKAQELDPKNQWAFSLMQRLLLSHHGKDLLKNKQYFKESDPEYKHFIGHLLYADGQNEQARLLWSEQDYNEDRPIFLPLALYLSALAQGKTEQAITAVDDLITNTNHPQLKAIFISERIRLIAGMGDQNALRSAIFRAVDESGPYATSSLLARMEREALKTSDFPLLLESLRIRLGLKELSVQAIHQKVLTSRTKHTGHLLYKLGWLLERNQQQHEAFTAYLKANECLPSESFVLLRLIELSRQLKSYDTLRNALKQLAIHNRDSQESANLWYQRGLVALHYLKDENEAQKDFLKAIQLYPTFSSALGALGQIAIKHNDQKALQRYFSDEIESLERQLNQKSDINTEEDELYRQYLSHTLVRRAYQFARLLQQQMGESEIALTYHLKALSISPQFTPSLLALEEIYELQGRFSRLVHLFEHRLQGEESKALGEDISEQEHQASQTKITALRMAIADICSTYLQDGNQASRHYAKVATFEAPEDLYALRKASESFERLKEYHSSLLIELRRAKLYRQRGDSDQLCSIKAATLQELVGDLNRNAPQALPLYQQAWQAYHHPSALDGLWRTVLYSKQINTLDYYLAPRTIGSIGSRVLLYLTAETLTVYGQVSRSNTLLSLWQEKHQQSNALDEKFAEWLEGLSLGAEQQKSRFASLPMDDLGWREYYQRSRAEAQIEAMVHDGDWQGANQALMKLAQIVPSVEQAFIWYRIAYHTEVGLKNTEQAIQHYKQALAIDEGCLPALAALRRISWLSQDWTSYKDMMRRSIKLESNPVVRQAFWTHLADVVYYVQREEAESIAYYSKALEEGQLIEDVQQDIPLALKQRYILLTQQGEDATVMAEIEAYLPKLNHQAKLTAWDWLAISYETNLNDQTQALTLNRRLIENDPQNTRAKRAVRRTLALGQDDDAYLQFLKTEIESELSELDALALITRCAHLYERMGDEKGAERYWRKAFKINSEFLPAYQGIGRSIHKREAWTELVTLYRKELGALTDKSPGKIEILRRLAEIYEYKLGRLSVAATCYEDIIELLPNDPASLSALDRIYCELKQWRSLARVWGTYAQQLKNPEHRGGAFLRVGEIYMEEIYAEDEALNAYELAYQANPQLHPAAWAIEMIMYPRNGWGRLIELYRDVRKHLTLPRERQILTHKMILELSINQIQKALESELFDESDSLEILWWKIYSATESGQSNLQVEALLQLSKQLQQAEESHAIALEAVNRICRGQPLQAKYRPYWEQLLLINARSRSAWLILMEQAHQDVVQKQDWTELRAILARMRWVSEDTRQQASCLWLQGLLERKFGSSRIASELLKEANEVSLETLVPNICLISYYLTPDDESRAQTYVALAQRTPVGNLKGSLLSRAAYLRAHDLHQKDMGLSLYVEAIAQGYQHAYEQAQRIKRNQELLDEPSLFAEEDAEYLRLRLEAEKANLLVDSPLQAANSTADLKYQASIDEDFSLDPEEYSLSLEEQSLQNEDEKAMNQELAENATTVMPAEIEEEEEEEISSQSSQALNSKGPVNMKVKSKNQKRSGKKRK